MGHFIIFFRIEKSLLRAEMIKIIISQIFEDDNLSIEFKSLKMRN
jgi:hypothetical protein